VKDPHLERTAVRRESGLRKRRVDEELEQTVEVAGYDDNSLGEV
jgi:hypothetical protein